MDNADEPEPLTFVADRIVILRSAHKVLTELGMDPDVGDLLETAAWIAGDDLPIIPSNSGEGNGDRETEASEDGTGA